MAELSEDERNALLREFQVDHGCWNHNGPRGGFCRACMRRVDAIVVPHLARIVAERTHAAVERAEVAEAKVERVEALIPDWPPPSSEDGMVRHGSFAHTAAFCCSQCPGYPHSGRVSALDLRNALSAAESPADGRGDDGAAGAGTGADGARGAGKGDV